jgi:dienelactone hydrolase
LINIAVQRVLKAFEASREEDSLKIKSVLPLLMFLGSANVVAQAVPGTVHQFLPARLQSADVVTYQMQRFLMGRAPRLPHPTSAEQWTAEAQQIRQHILSDVIYHGWPKDWIDSPPKFEDMGAVPVPAGARYRAEKFRYEIVPGFYSTAVLYEPAQVEGQVPAVLNVLGHYPAGKSMPFEQKLCVNEALRGMIALSLAFLDEGELKVEENEHSYGSDLDLVGVSGVGLFYLAARRGLDYLYDNPHVDRRRIAMTGQSGGGWQTLMLSSLDTRVRLAIPVAGFASIEGRFERIPGEPGDYEQLAPDLLDGQDYPTFAALLAPRPTLEINNAEDSCCFRAPLVKPDIFDAVRPFFALYGKEDAFGFHADTEVLAHNYGHDDRQQAYGFLDKWFNLTGTPDEIPVGEDLNTYTQLAAGVPADNLTILGLAKQFASKLQHPAIPADPATRAMWAQTERAALVKAVNYQPVTVDHPWYVADTDHNTVQSISFRFGFSDGLSATGVWIRSEWTPDGAPMTMIINDAGREGADREVWDHYPEVANAVERGDQVFVLSILFTGDDNPLGDDVGRFGYMMNAVGTPPLGIEVAQLLEITHWAQQRWSPSATTLESSGFRMQVVSLAAGALEPHLFKSITIHQGMRSLRYLLDEPVNSSKVPDMFCRDFYKDFDLNILKAMAEPTTVTESDYLDSTGSNR